MSGLIAAGLAPRTTPADEPDEPLEVVDDDTVTALRAENERLRAENERLRADLDHSRELAAERARTVDTLTQALELMARALPPGPPAPMAYTEETAEPVEPDIGHPWRRWRNRT